MKLCDWIVEHQIDPKTLSAELSAVGFRKERIAEIKRVCFTSREIYEDYRKRLVGFRAALAKARSANKQGQESAQSKWNELFAAFEKLSLSVAPLKPYHQGNGRNLFYWTDLEAPATCKTFTIPGWRITVECEQPNPIRRNQTKKQL